jgi:aminopeptidase N
MKLVRFSVCAMLVVLVSAGGVTAAAATPQARPFGRGHAYVHVTEVAPYTFDSTLIRVRFDVARGTVFGDEVVVVRSKRDGLRSLPFDTRDIHYASVTLNGKPAVYSIDAARQRMDVRLASPAPAGARLAVEFKYSTNPQRGVYFVRPDKSYPDVTPEIWTQGEATDNRNWFPTWDEPNQKTPAELVVTVPHGWTVIADGYLTAHAIGSATESWDWKTLHPISTYLIAFAAGPLSEHHTTLGQAKLGNVGTYGNGAMDVDSFVQPPRADLNAVCFGRTNEMVAYLQQLIGVAYPFEKYDQTTAERFTFGGMENASATILTDHALHPAIEDVENSCDVLVAHELAQHWFGDDVTMSDWSNGWINEGFATYFHELWGEKDLGETSFEYDRYQAQQGYFDETKRYYRPIVDYDYADALELFDTSGHERPAQALHMLRHMFGDARFFAAIRAYLLEYQYNNASTHQFFASIGKSLGTDLTWFENEWFYRAAYPHYDVSDRYDATSKTLTLEIKQRNHDGKPFRMPVQIEAVVDGVSHVIEPTIDRNQQIVTMTDVPSEPQMVLFDPNNNVLRQLTFDKPVAELAYQLANAPHVADREWALDALSKWAGLNNAGHETAMEAVRTAATSDRFYGVRADAVVVAGRFGDSVAVETALKDADARVRLAAIQSAGVFAGAAPPSLIAHLETLSDDADPKVAAAALTSLGAINAPGAFDRLMAALNRDSYGQAVAIGALRGLAAYGDARAYSLIAARTVYGTQEEERAAAVLALAQLAVRTKQSSQALPLLIALVSNDPLIATRAAATTALGILGDTGAIPTLERVERADSQLIVQIDAWNAIQSIRDASAR